MQLIAEGSSKLASVPSGGGGAAVAAGGAAAGGAAAEAPKEEEKKEEGKHPCLEYDAVLAGLTFAQRRRSPTRTWASVSSTKRRLVPKSPKVTRAFPENLDDPWARLQCYLHGIDLSIGFGDLGFDGVGLLRRAPSDTRNNKCIKALSGHHAPSIAFLGWSICSLPPPCPRRMTRNG